MTWFHTVALPLATILALYIGIKRKAPAWKHGALVLGCALMLGGVWVVSGWSTMLLIGGAVLFFIGVPRNLASGGASSRR